MGLLIPLFVWIAIPAVCLAPPLPTRSSSDSTEANPQATTTLPADEPPETKDDEEIRKPVEEKVFRATLAAAHTPAKHGDTSGESWIAQRTMVEDYCGWGWVKKDKESWRQARWRAPPEHAPCPIPSSRVPWTIKTTSTDSLEPLPLTVPMNRKPICGWMCSF
jgi:hypothetical protein